MFVQFLLFYLCSKIPICILFFEKVFYAKQAFHLKWFSQLPFSAGDFFYLMLGLYVLYGLFNIIRNKRRDKQILRIMVLVNVLYMVYQFNWGMLYYKNPIGIEKPEKKIPLHELKNWAVVYIHLANKERQQIQDHQNGYSAINSHLLLYTHMREGLKKLPKKYYAKNYFETINIKPSLFGSLMSSTGLLGYYNPFSSEAQYNSMLPNSMLPFTIAHESAHQLGFAREQEANFIGYLICEHSEDPSLRYSAYLYTSLSLLSAVNREDKNFKPHAERLFSEQVRRDLRNEKEFQKKHDNFLRDIFYFTNDLFLKFNQQEGAVTYSYFIDLLIEYKKESHLAM